MKATSTNTQDNPCVRNCCLDENDICQGCFRHLDEILSWSEADKRTRDSIVDNANRRKAHHVRLFPGFKGF